MFFFQAEDGIRDLVRSRGLGDVYKRQRLLFTQKYMKITRVRLYRLPVSYYSTRVLLVKIITNSRGASFSWICLLYTSDAADERSSVDLGGRRIIKKKNERHIDRTTQTSTERKIIKKKTTK